MAEAGWFYNTINYKIRGESHQISEKQNFVISNKFQSTIECVRKYSARISHKMYGNFFFEKERQ